MLRSFKGYKDGCTFCGKPLTSKYYMNPFYNPSVYSCDRFICKIKRKCKRIFVEKIISFKRKIENFLRKILIKLDQLP